MYYNEERKETYFNFLNSMRTNAAEPIKYIFKKVADSEKLWDKDICDFTYEEICKILASFNAISLGAIRKNVSILKTYTDWCCQNRLSIDNINHYLELDTEKLKSYVNKNISKFISREELYEALHILKNDSDKFILLALYENVRSEFIGELFALRQENLDHVNKTITFPSGETKHLSKELYFLAIRSSEEDVYQSYTGDAEVRLNTGNIINSRNNATKDTLENLGLRARKRVGLIKDVCGMPTITVPKLPRAGLIDNIQTIMKELNITKEEFFGLNFEKYIGYLNPNYEITLEKKVITKTAIYDYI